MFEGIKNFFRGVAFNTKAFAGLIMICLLFIIVFIIPGIYLLVKNHALNYQSDGTIVNKICNNSELDDISSNYCNLTITYPANDRKYTGVSVNNREDKTAVVSGYTVGQHLPVYYDRNNPRAFIIHLYRTKTIGIALLSVGLALITIICISYSLKYRKEIINQMNTNN
jgi:hypothetical protein